MPLAEQPPLLTPPCLMPPRAISCLLTPSHAPSHLPSLTSPHSLLPSCLITPHPPLIPPTSYLLIPPHTSRAFPHPVTPPLASAYLSTLSRASSHLSLPLTPPEIPSHLLTPPCSSQHHLMPPCTSPHLCTHPHTCPHLPPTSSDHLIPLCPPPTSGVCVFACEFLEVRDQLFLIFSSRVRIPCTTLPTWSALRQSERENDTSFRPASNVPQLGRLGSSVG